MSVGTVQAGLRSRINTKQIAARVNATSLDTFGWSHFNSTSEPVGTSISYLYAPGLMGSGMLLGRYCPEFIACTGEHIRFKESGHVIGKPCSVVCFPETCLKKPGGFSLDILKVIIDDIRSKLYPVAIRILQDKWKFEIVSDDPNAQESVLNVSFKFGQANVAQKRDIAIFHATYMAHQAQYPGTRIIAYGDSRGAATILNWLAKHQPTKVGAAVLEGIFDTVEHSIKHFLYDDKPSNATVCLHSIFSFVFGSYNSKGPFPVHFVETVPLDIPILFVTSLKDGLVASQSTIKLYQRMRLRGAQKVHLLVLQHAYHPEYMMGNTSDKNLYETVVHAFYKNYNLPHNIKAAQQGAQAFALTQPEPQGLLVRYGLTRCPDCI
jgi:hypothetical protein